MIEEKLSSLKISLPEAPKPVGAYVPVVRTGNLIFVSGQIPLREGRLEFQGKVPTEVSIETAQKAARLCTLNILAQIKSEIKSLDNISKIIRLSGFVNCSNDFTEQHKIINAASDFLFEIFGEKGRHSRIAVGVPSLPLNSTVELDLVAEVSQV